MGLFRRKYAASVVLVDIASDSVAGAYVRYEEGEKPALIYTRRVPIEVREDEAHERAMLRALKILGDILIHEGAPALARVTGSGSIENIFVAIDAPWQETRVRTERFEQKEPFVFNRNIVAEILEKNAVEAGKLATDESIIGTMLNGYETSDPYGKRAHRATIVILTSLIEEKIARGIASVFRSLYHTRRIATISSNSLRYQVLRARFPHEHDALVLDATKSYTSSVLIRKGLFVAVSEIGAGTEEESWVHAVKDEFADIAKQYPLPRTILLLSRESDASVLRERLDSANLGSLWLSDNPPAVVPVLTSQFSDSVRHVTTAAPDLSLLLMTLYWHQTLNKDEASSP